MIGRLKDWWHDNVTHGGNFDYNNGRCVCGYMRHVWMGRRRR
jgi:hypothetical protein